MKFHPAECKKYKISWSAQSFVLFSVKWQLQTSVLYNLES